MELDQIIVYYLDDTEDMFSTAVGVDGIVMGNDAIYIFYRGEDQKLMIPMTSVKKCRYIEKPSPNVVR